MFEFLCDGCICELTEVQAKEKVPNFIDDACNGLLVWLMESKHVNPFKNFIEHDKLDGTILHFHLAINLVPVTPAV